MRLRFGDKVTMWEPGQDESWKLVFLNWLPSDCKGDWQDCSLHDGEEEIQANSGFVRKGWKTPKRKFENLRVERRKRGRHGTNARK